MSNLPWTFQIPLKKNSKSSRSSSAGSAPKKRNKSNSDQSASSGMSGEWDSEKKEQFMDQIIALGYKAANLDEMAQKLGLNKRQLINQLTTGRNNFRSMAVAAVKGG
ncbi:uncharacterized protein L201_000949 [Kwoniella dendrophila CBS 6074]|uniref:UBA domain-containing protein n=1 Tax=Kwoniella dendrophila CBS 6074 TaxID=1295534 RepID=A0AAX4JMJ0_9TREE